MKRWTLFALACALGALLAWGPGCGSPPPRREYPDPYGTKPPLAPAPEHPG